MCVIVWLILLIPTVVQSHLKHVSWPCDTSIPNQLQGRWCPWGHPPLSAPSWDQDLLRVRSSCHVCLVGGVIKTRQTWHFINCSTSLVAISALLLPSALPFLPVPSHSDTGRGVRCAWARQLLSAVVTLTAKTNPGTLRYLLKKKKCKSDASARSSNWYVSRQQRVGWNTCCDLTWMKWWRVAANPKRKARDYRAVRASAAGRAPCPPCPESCRWRSPPWQQLIKITLIIHACFQESHESQGRVFQEKQTDFIPSVGHQVSG